MKCYVYLVLLGQELNRDEVKAFLDTMTTEVQDWFYSMPGSIFVIGTISANELYKKIEARFGQKRILISELSSANRQGWLPTAHWDKIYQYERGSSGETSGK